MKALGLRSCSRMANNAKHGDAFFVAASPPLQSRACWRRYQTRRVRTMYKKYMVISWFVVMLLAACAHAQMNRH